MTERTKIAFIGKPESPILRELASTHELIAAAEPGEENAPLAVDLSRTGAREVANHPAIQRALARGTPILLESTEDAAQMAALTGVGVPGVAAVFQTTDRGQAGHVTVFTEGPPDVGPPEHAEGDVERRSADTPLPAELEGVPDEPSKPGPATGSEEEHSIGEEIRALLAAPAGPLRATAGHELDPVPDGVPSLRRTIEIRPGAYHPRLITWYSGGKRTALSQSAQTNLVMSVELYASSNPRCKLLRLTLIGSGVSPGVPDWNEWRERGGYQDKLHIAFGPVSRQAGWKLLDSQPKTVNKQADYTASTTVSGKVSGKAKDEGGEIGGEIGFSISSSVKTSMSDFEVLDRSDGSRGIWDFEMAQMGDGNASYTYPYDINKPGACLVTWDGYICPVAKLGRSNLYPACQAVWEIPAEAVGIQSLSFEVDQRICYAAANLVRWQSSWLSTPRSTQFKVDLDQVQVP